jgi:DNA polymerase/3'-5' exonuclease PolX
MKVYTLIFMFNKLLENVKKENPSSLRYIIMAYRNVICKIKEHGLNSNITKTDIKNLDITDNMKKKLCNIFDNKISSKDLQSIKKMKLKEELINITGIGKNKTEELIKLGLKSVNQLKLKKWQSFLNSDTLILLKYKPLKRIPYIEIKKIENILSIKGAKIVGGFLRKKSYSKDIDVMLVSSKKDILDDYVKYLKTKFSDVIIYLKGNDKMSLLIKSGGIYLKLDIFRSLPKYQYAMLLYSTGSKLFNIRMRGIAKQKGYLLNQFGLFKLPFKKGDKPLNVKSEKDIFKKLNLPYVRPENR